MINDDSGETKTMHHNVFSFNLIPVIIFTFNMHFCHPLAVLLLICQSNQHTACKIQELSLYFTMRMHGTESHATETHFRAQLLHVYSIANSKEGERKYFYLIPPPSIERTLIPLPGKGST
jgi:hypothetical protein